jgi:hypothetical protein
MEQKDSTGQEEGLPDKSAIVRNYDALSVKLYRKKGALSSKRSIIMPAR